MIIDWIRCDDINAHVNIINGVVTIYCNTVYSGLFYHELFHIINDDVPEEASTYVEMRADDYAASKVGADVYMHELLQLRQCMIENNVELSDLNVRINHLS